MAGKLHKVGVVALAAALMSISACSKSGESDSGSVAADVDLTAVEKTISDYKAVPTFTEPGPAFDASKAAGKTIFYIPLNSSLPFDTLMAKGAEEAAVAAGAKFVLYGNQGKPAEWVQGMDSAISRKVDLIVLAGSPDPKLLGPQIRAAKAAGIPVISTHLYDSTYVKQGLAEKVPTAVQTALLKDPKINFVIPVYDGMTPLLVSGITQAGKTNDVQIVAYNGTASVLQMIQDGDLVAAEIGEPIGWLGWSIVDQALRIMSGVQPVENENTPLRVFDDENVDETGKPATQTEGYGDPDVYKDAYRKLWGLG